MSTPYVDDSGETRLIGHLTAPGATVGDVLTVQADGSLKPAPGGGGASPISAVYSGNNVSIGNGADGLLDWSSTDSQVDVLNNVSAPTRPTALASGTYIVSAWVKSFPLTVGGYYTADLTLDPNEGIAEMQADSPADTDGSGRNLCISAASFIPAGGELTILISNLDGAATRNFLLKNATIVFLPS